MKVTVNTLFFRGIIAKAFVTTPIKSMLINVLAIMHASDWIVNVVIMKILAMVYGLINTYQYAQLLAEHQHD